MPVFRSGSGHADDLGGAECVEAIYKGDPDVDFGSLAIGIPRIDALTEGLQASHLGLHAAAGVVSGPPLPECPTVVTRGAQGFVARLGSRAVLFPSSTVPSGRYDCRAATCDDGAVAAAGIAGAIHCPAGASEGCCREGAVTVPMSSSSGIWPNKSGRTGLSPSRLGVNSTARISEVAVSIARCTLRHWRRP